MTSTAITPRLPRLPHSGTLTQVRVCLSEWTKLRSVRSTLWSLFVALLFTVGIAALATFVGGRHWAHDNPGHSVSDFDPLGHTFAGVQLAQLAIGVLGVLVITGEYSTGMIRASMTAVPTRLPVLWGKAVVYALTILVLMVPSALVAFFIGHAILAKHGLAIGFGHAGVARAVVGAGLYLTVIGLFGLGLGAIVRNTAGGIASFAGIMFVIPPLMNVLPKSWNNGASPYLPLQAGERIMEISGGTLSPWAGFGILCAYAAAALAIAAVLMKRRDV